MADVNVVAMHMSDGIVNLSTSALFGVIAVVGIGFCAWKARSELDERTVPMAGLVAAFIFAVQMINFPILAGVSGHLLGGALAAILVGPFTGALCVAIVLVVQALLFADGGLSALGTNITNMALIGVCVGYGVALLLSSIVLRRRSQTAPTPPGRSLGGLGGLAFLAALCGTVAASMGFVVEYGLGGSAAISLDTVAAYIVGTHVLIGIGEGLLTALTVVAVARARPDLVYLLRRPPSRQKSVS